MTEKSNKSLAKLTEEQIKKMRKIFQKVIRGEISIEQAIDQVIDPAMEELFPSLMSTDETREAFTTLVGLMPRFAGKNSS